MAPMDRHEDRYRNDVEFRLVVDTLQSIILKLEMTPSEVREAAMYACVLVEMRYPRPFSVRVRDEADAAANVLRHYESNGRGEPPA